MSKGCTIQSTQPCWKCKKALGGCSWSKRFETVEGWKAITIVKEAKPGYRGYTTYNIIFCPEFEAD